MDEPTTLERAQAHLKAGFRLDGQGLPGSHALAAQIAVVAQAEAAHRQADALERIADVLSDLRRALDSITYKDGIGVRVHDGR